MLTFMEEIMLLALDDDKGVIQEFPYSALEYAMAGAGLMELALLNRLDSDLTHLILVDRTPVDDPVLNMFLTRIAAEPGTHPIQYWIESFAESSTEIRKQVLARLVEKRVLQLEKHRILWVFATRRYPIIDNREHTEITARLRALIRSDEIPDPRDIILICLINACRLCGEIFSPDELPHVQARINQLSRMDLIGQTVTRAIRDVQESVASILITMQKVDYLPPGCV